jgi:hypothetical protein
MKTIRVSPAIEARIAARKRLADALQAGTTLAHDDAIALVEPCEFLSDAEATAAFKRLTDAERAA